MTSRDLGDLLEQTGQPRIGPAVIVPPRSKYHAVRSVDADGQTWDSNAERRRYDHLVLLRKAGMISELARQPRFNIMMNGIFCGFYKGDFEYRNGLGELVIEDVKNKATSTPVYRLKKKLVEAQYGIVITEVSSK